MKPGFKSFHLLGQRLDVNWTGGESPVISHWLTHRNYGFMLDLANRNFNAFFGKYYVNATLIDEKREKARKDQEHRESTWCSRHNRAVEESNYTCEYGPYWMCRECNPEAFRRYR